MSEVYQGERLEEDQHIVPEHEEKQDTEYRFGDFKDSEKFFEKLLEEMLPSINNHEYSAIVGDDTSGRIATMILRKVIAESYRRDGIKTPETIFYAGGYTKDPRGGRDYLSEQVYENISEDFKKRENKEGKVLIVTEYMLNGRSMDMLIGALKDAGADCEVATLALPFDKNRFMQTHTYLENLINTKVYSGGVLSPESIIPFYKETIMAGVEKKFHSKNIHASPVRHSQAEVTKPAREDADHLAQKLIKKYLP